MYRRILWTVLALLTLSFSAAAVLKGQNDATQPSDGVHARHAAAINLLRRINTAEVVYKNEKGRFAEWDALLERPEFSARGWQWPAGAHFSKAPDILLGWRLRMNIHADGQGYDVMLEDATDETSGWAAITDERAVIRESKSI